ncbi:MAG: hypothetical protein ACQCN5_07895 [Candidatus Bathyarchaeia archaeon]
MKKTLLAFICLLLFCIVLVVPVLLQYPRASWGDSKPDKTVQPTSTYTLITPQLTPKNTPCTTPTNTPKQTQQPTPQTSLPVPVQSSNRTLDEAIANATYYLQNTSEPYALLWLNVAYRRFNITVFDDSLQLYDNVLAQSPQENQPLLRLFRRIGDYNNPIQSGDLQAVTSETDKLTVPALYCNRYGLSINYAETLAQAANSQDYLVTHALLATIWIGENGYGLSMPDGYYYTLYHANAALINNDSMVTDLELEAATFLCLAGQSSMVNTNFIKNVIAAQNSDGGWSTSNTTSEASNWHSTVLALLLLLDEKNPAASYPPTLAAIV